MATSSADAQAARAIHRSLSETLGRGAKASFVGAVGAAAARVRQAAAAHRAANPQYPIDHIHACLRLLRYGSTSTGYVRSPISDAAFESANKRQGGAPSFAREYQDCSKGLVADSAK